VAPFFIITVALFWVDKHNGIARSAIKVRLTHRVLPLSAVWRSEPVSGRGAPI